MLLNTIPCWTAHKNYCTLLSSSLPPFSALPSPLPNSGSCPYYPTETRVTKVTKSLTFQPSVYTTEHSCHLELFFIHNTIILHDLIPLHLPSTSVSLNDPFFQQTMGVLPNLSLAQLSLSDNWYIQMTPKFLVLFSFLPFNSQVPESMSTCTPHWYLKVKRTYLPCKMCLFTRSIKI